MLIFIDKCVEIRESDGKRYDEMLTYEDCIIFIELKEIKGKTRNLEIQLTFLVITTIYPLIKTKKHTLPIKKDLTFRNHK